MVFDTTTVVSALLFADGRLAWLRSHWQGSDCVRLISAVTVSELKDQPFLDLAESGKAETPGQRGSRPAGAERQNAVRD